jgi:hypothetical protein
MIILYISAFFCILLVLFTVISLTRKQPGTEKVELMRVSETKITAIMGYLLFAMGFFILCMKFLNPGIAGTDELSYLSVAGIALFSVAIGCGILFYTFLRKVIVYEDGFVFVSMFGKSKKIAWKEINEIKVPTLTNKATFLGKSTSITVGGETKAYKAFLKIAIKYIKPEVGCDTLATLLKRSLF